MFSYGPPHIVKQEEGDRLEPTYSSSVRIRDVAQSTCQKRWRIRRSGETGSGISVLAASYENDGDDDDDDDGDEIFFKQIKCIWNIIRYLMIKINTKNCIFRYFNMHHLRNPPLDSAISNLNLLTPNITNEATFNHKYAREIWVQSQVESYQRL